MSAHTAVEHHTNPPEHDEPRRPWTIFALMIAAHHVWGTITGLLVSYLSEEVGE